MIIPVEEIIERLSKIEALLLRIINENKDADENKMLTPYEVGRVFSVSRTTICNWTKNGYIKSYHIGGRVYYKNSEVVEAAKHLKKCIKRS